MWHWGEILVDIKMHLFCYQKVGTRSRSVSVHSDLSYDESSGTLRADVILEYDHSGSHNDALTGYYQSCPVSCHE